jgi:HlyD family secretion protein
MLRRVLKIGVPVAVLAGILYWAFAPKAVPADFARVERGPLEVTVEDEGRTRVRQRYVISAPVPGRLMRIELEPGDPVIANETVLARFQPTDPALLDARTRAELEARVRAAQAALEGAKADRARVEADLAFARKDLARADQLVKERVIAPRERDATALQAESLERSLEAADFAVRSAEHQLEEARAALTVTRSGRTEPILLRSPIDGVVLKRLQESEIVVQPGQPLLEVGDVRDLEIVSDMLSTAAVQVRPGQPVHIDQWGGGHPLDGTVRRVEPSGFTKISALGVEEQRVNVIVDFTGDPEGWKHLGDGFRVEVRVVTASSEHALTVPASSLFRDGDGWAVFRVNGGRAERRPVRIGLRNGLQAEVLEGLSEGDQVVVYPSDAVKDGVELVPRS